MFVSNALGQVYVFIKKQKLYVKNVLVLQYVNTIIIKELVNFVLEMVYVSI